MATLLAETAMSARLAWVDRNLVANGNRGNISADFSHDTGGFVSKGHWLANTHCAKAAMAVIMKVGTANAALTDFNFDLIRARFSQISPI